MIFVILIQILIEHFVIIKLIVGLHGLYMSHKKDARLIWVIAKTSSLMLDNQILRTLKNRGCI